MNDDKQNDVIDGEFREMDEQSQQPQGDGMPPAFVAVFYDDKGEVQVGTKGALRPDLIEWAHMLRIAVEKLELQHHLLVREQMEKQRQQGNNLIVPR